MNKKVGVGIFCFLLISILFVNIEFVSAQNQIIDGIGKVFESSYSIINSVIDNLLKPLVKLVLTNGGETLTSGLLFAKLLFLLIVLGVVHFALDKANFLDEKKGLQWLIVIVVAILATRWLGTEALLQTIILPYSVLGIAISAALPFIIYFLFIEIGFRNTDEHNYSVLRKIAWVLFIVVFIGLWYSRGDVIRDAGSYASYIYPITLLASIGVLLFDGTVQRVWAKAEVNKSISKIASRRARELRRELNDLYGDLARETPGTQPWRDTRREIEYVIRQIRELMRGGI